MILDLEAPEELHPKTRRLVQDFAAALAQKLYVAEKKYGYSDEWLATNWEDECRRHLRDHVAKGDPRDVAAYCAFMWKHGWSTAGSNDDFLGMGLIIKEQRERIKYLEVENKLLFDHIKGTDADLEAFNRALECINPHKD